MEILKNLYYHKTLKLNTKKVFIMLFHSLDPGRFPRAEVFKFIFKQQNIPPAPPWNLQNPNTTTFLNFSPMAAQNWEIFVLGLFCVL